MEDADLEQIRKARLEQLKAQGGAGNKASGGGGGQAQQAEQKRQQEADARNGILNQILHPEAMDRLGRIRLVKESRATEVTEDQLKELLNAVSDKQEEEKIVVSRRKGWADEDDDDLLDL
ncbi:hypothetical protein RB594_005053 [Gaeumannomyces avenae]